MKDLKRYNNRKWVIKKLRKILERDMNLMQGNELNEYEKEIVEEIDNIQVLLQRIKENYMLKRSE